MTFHTASRSTARRRVAAALAAPVLALCVACGGGDDGVKDEGIASAPDGPTADGASGKDKAKDKGKDGGSGSSKPAAEGKSAFYDAQLTYVRCMRTKAGLKDYPDPKLSGYLDWPKIEKLVDPNGRGEEYKGGKNGVCADELRAAMNQEPERDAQKDYESMLAHAKCMRDNGVSKFTNPTMSGGNVIPGGDPNPANPALDQDSPAYERAEQACASKLLEGLDGMQ
ncbi:hypothetical protein [Streptomyces flavofungini]|uniref:Lipoprotein n=1 Tax=Streptomyces flavofungini TaxID=68200 RepID=A0ABS0X168_9ACTN|nr:hypothetical protein [Streptomyces flavofungini]MBJ3806888.1 hypothetical protein [Streptomyces flavofungini]GHC59907.1 hypothetical protein GCM10010349_28850 [Streptomyces flavofungini]